MGTSSTPPPSRLRAAPMPRPFQIVLVEPEIPPNTGNIVRLCAGTGAILHLVGPLGFRIDAHSVRRAGLDCWKEVDLRRHQELAAFIQAFTRASTATATEPAGALHLFSARAERSYLTATYRPGDALVFGRESTGLPDALLAAHPDRVLGIPLLGPVRSLNLANAVGIVLFEALRQCGALDRTFKA